MPKEILSGVVILDLSTAVAGPHGTQLLGDLGAEIIRVEISKGGRSQRVTLEGPAFQIGGMDPFFLSVNRNKKSILLELGKPEGLQLFYEMVKKADVVYDNFRSGVMQSRKIDYDTLKDINPRIISCSITGYGSTGPIAKRASYDPSIQAQTGILSYLDKKDSSGLVAYSGVALADLIGGSYAAYAIAAALHHLEKTGKGCRIEVALYDALLSWFYGYALYPLNFGKERDLMTAKPPVGVFRTKDKPIVLAAHRNSIFSNLCRALGREDWLTDERFNGIVQRVINGNLLTSLIEKELSKKNRAEWVEIFDREGVAFGEVYEMSEALASPQTIQRNMVVNAEHPVYGKVKMLGNPIKFDGLEDSYSPPPLAGEHTDRVLTDLLKYSKSQIDALREKGIIN